MSKKSTLSEGKALTRNFGGTKAQLKRLLKADELSKVNFTPMVWGPPGVGKSAMMKQIAKELGYTNLIIILTGTKNPIDISGVPYIDSASESENHEQFIYKGKRFKYIPSDIFADIKKGEKTIIFFDEVNTGTLLNQVQAFQVALDRRIGDLELGTDVRVVMAGNRVQDSSAVVPMSNPLKTRLSHIELVADATEFVADFFKRLHISVSAFLKANPSAIHLNNFDATLIEGTDANKLNSVKSNIEDEHNTFPCPRNWEMLSEYLIANSDDAKSITVEDISSIIGQAIAHKFYTYYKYESQIPNVYDIISGKLPEREYYKHKIFAAEKNSSEALLQVYFIMSLGKNLVNILDDAYESYVKSITNISDETIKLSKREGLEKLVKQLLTNYFTATLKVHDEYSGYSASFVKNTLKNSSNKDLYQLYNDCQLTVLSHSSFSALKSKLSLIGDSKSV